MEELHDIILGSAETWDVPKGMFTFLGSNDESFNPPNTPKSDVWNDEYMIEPKYYPCQSEARKYTEISEKAGILVVSPNYLNTTFEDVEGYPNVTYEDGLNCRYKVKSLGGTEISLQFWSFDVEVSN